MATILVVDDEPSILKLVSTSLELRGYTIITAHDGVEALDKAFEHRPDLILLDIMMPKMDGNEVRRRLLKDERTKDIPIVHLSAVGDFQKQAQALDEGVVDYITKPFSPNDLRLKVMEVLNPSQSDQVKREHDRKAGQTRAIADIMRRKSEDG